jgi:hypothetical protein
MKKAAPFILHCFFKHQFFQLKVSFTTSIAPGILRGLRELGIAASEMRYRENTTDYEANSNSCLNK